MQLVSQLYETELFLSVVSAGHISVELKAIQ